MPAARKGASPSGLLRKDRKTGRFGLPGAAGRGGGGVARAVLDPGRQRADQDDALVAVEQGFGDGAEPDLPALDVAEVFEHRLAGGVARGAGAMASVRPMRSNSVSR
ncbi:MAG: hypothetical protein AVDCRST_MAG04-3532 [uncultured Acetobacteraceae bacterium]|uniref:Uncharacterized protein n=1 Tax=uncultured Acetobacteraceae bacterium TaxID=169975 RepID=A0A6J4JF89_9PROT|nr:MAG: hypothetical protein AVDCRST_MAG04-3532 [uncultured Acetobacteraceae bacterium]